MSKLHKLRREIEKNPTNWISGWGAWQTPRSASVSRKGRPLVYNYTNSYFRFVRKVLHDLGYKNVK